MWPSVIMLKYDFEELRKRKQEIVSGVWRYSIRGGYTKSLSFLSKIVRSVKICDISAQIPP